MANRLPLKDHGLALGVVVFEARILCEALLLSRISNEAIFLKSRSSIEFLYPRRKTRPPRLEPRRFRRDPAHHTKSMSGRSVSTTTSRR